jgi:tubulin polyglutamylase TTLL6/13
MVLNSLFLRRVYPNGNEEKYEKYFENSGSLFQETTASKARTECSRFATWGMLI